MPELMERLSAFHTVLSVSSVVQMRDYAHGPTKVTPSTGAFPLGTVLWGNSPSRDDKPILPVGLSFTSQDKEKAKRREREGQTESVIKLIS